VASTGGAKASGCSIPGSSPGLAQGRCPLLDFSSLPGGLRALLIQRLGLVQVFRFSSRVSVCGVLCV
jgi:hypothetical protein